MDVTSTMDYLNKLEACLETTSNSAEDDDEDDGTQPSKFMDMLRGIVREEVAAELDARAMAEANAKEEAARNLAVAQAKVHAASLAFDLAKKEAEAASVAYRDATSDGESIPVPAVQPPPQGGKSLTLREQAKLRPIAAYGKYAIPVRPESAAAAAAAVLAAAQRPHKQQRPFIDASGMGMTGRVTQRG